MTVRIPLPTRRITPTKNPIGKNWSEHKPDLKEDFNSHCGWCGSYDGFRHTYFEVDHFIPKSFFELSGKIGYCQYDNLVYSCKFCNNKKLDKWPSQSETVFSKGDEGFVDPCDIAYDSTHLYRTSDGGIMWKTKLGEWMATKAFGFDERDYSIKLLWNLNQTRIAIEALVVLLAKEINGSSRYNLIKSKAQEYSLEYFLYHKELIEFYNG
ncbi:HNH endonuclease [Fluviicola chungangensis]|uniref:HNH endonuclease n=1 Tax=Fluviicola chungangensis TaxID=2597671 RepID=A0A556MGB5_9FLAO|nr:HNH endonuclease signature motif containing protein [Fluviicola chungangensis]TSJ38966.1 HNH endonuclease [Fluviicola chungangensis]